MQRRTFKTSGLVAMSADARGVELEASPPTKTTVTRGVAVVPVIGPLTRNPGSPFDSYSSVKARVAKALDSSARAVVLKLDSPGGELGCTAVARELRAMATKAGKPLAAFVAGQATAGAYALACAAERIWIDEAGQAGGLCVTDAVIDTTAADAQMGVKFVLVTSGQWKSQGNAHQQIDARLLASTQGLVDQATSVMLATTAELRGVKRRALEELGGATLIGKQAVRAGLVDRVGTLDQLIDSLGALVPAKATQVRATSAPKLEKPMAKKAEEQNTKTLTLAFFKELKKRAEKGDSYAKGILKMLNDGEDDKPEKKEDEAKRAAQRAALAAKMGLSDGRPAIRREGNTVQFGVMTPTEARAAIAAREESEFGRHKAAYAGARR